MAKSNQTLEDDKEKEIVDNITNDDEQNEALDETLDDELAEDEELEVGWIQKFQQQMNTLNTKMENLSQKIDKKILQKSPTKPMEQESEIEQMGETKIPKPNLNRQKENADDQKEVKINLQKRPLFYKKKK